MLRGRDGVHQWESPGGLTIVLNELDDLSTGDAVYPRFRLVDVDHGFADPGDNADKRVGAAGMIPRASYRGSRTHVYTIEVMGRTIDELRTGEETLRQAFADQSAEGRMDVNLHALHDDYSAGDNRYFNAKPLALTPGTDAPDSDLSPSLGFRREWVLALRNHDGRYFAGIDYEELGRDGFAQSVGALTGKTAEVGGTWLGGGDSDDFNVDGSGLLSRVAEGDSSLLNGRFARLDLNLAGTFARFDYAIADTASGNPHYRGLLLRYVDTSNFLCLTPVGSKVTNGAATVVKVVGGVAVTEAIGPLSSGEDELNTWMSLAVTLTEGGDLTYWAAPQGEELGEELGSYSHADLGAGGALVSGDVGLYDAFTVTSPSTFTRLYDNLVVGDLDSEGAIQNLKGYW